MGAFASRCIFAPSRRHKNADDDRPTSKRHRKGRRCVGATAHNPEPQGRSSVAHLSDGVSDNFIRLSTGRASNGCLCEIFRHLRTDTDHRVVLLVVERSPAVPTLDGCQRQMALALDAAEREGFRLISLVPHSCGRHNHAAMTAVFRRFST